MDNLNKKIVIAAEIFPPDIGGPATYARKLADVLVSEGYSVSVVTYGGTEASSLISSARPVGGDYQLLVTNRNIPLPFRYFVYVWKLFWVSRNADVIYAQGPLSAGWPAILVKRVLGIRLVVKVVGDQAWERARQAGKTQLLLDDFQKQVTTGKIRSIQNIQKDVLKGADAVITVSHWFKGIIAGWGIDPSKITVIHNAVKKQLATGDRQLTIPKGDIILSVGRLVKWKGFEILIKIMPELLKVNPNFKLVIVGEGPESEKLKDQCSKLKLEDAVIFTKKLHKEDLAEYYSVAKMFVLNSGYENWSHVTVEAMHAGLPIVISNEGGNSETVQEGKLGVLVAYNNAEEIKNAIVELWNDPKKREELSKNAREYVESYTFNDMLEKTKNILF